MCKILACVFLVAMLSSTPVKASDGDSYGIHIASFHDRGGFNTITPGIYYKDSSGLTVGILNNSEGNLGVYAGKTFETGNKMFGLTVGAITGYKPIITPLIVPSLYIKNIDLRLSWLSKPPKTNGASALHISFERAF